MDGSVLFATALSFSAAFSSKYQSINQSFIFFRMTNTIRQCVTHYELDSKAQQEAQLMLTNLRDVFISQSRLPNIAPFHMLNIVSSSYCTIVTLSLRRVDFLIFDFKKCRDPENWVRSPSRSLDMSPCIWLLLTFCSNYGSISCRFWDIQWRKMSWPWNRGQRSLKIIDSGIIR